MYYSTSSSPPPPPHTHIHTHVCACAQTYLPLSLAEVWQCFEATGRMHANIVCCACTCRDERRFQSHSNVCVHACVVSLFLCCVYAQACNVFECGYDAGDCKEEAGRPLFRVHISNALAMGTVLIPEGRRNCSFWISEDADLLIKC